MGLTGSEGLAGSAPAGGAGIGAGQAGFHSGPNGGAKPSAAIGEASLSGAAEIAREKGAGSSATTIQGRVRGFGQRALASMSVIRIGGGLECLYWNAAGRTMASALLLFRGFAATETVENAGSAALALALFSRELVADADDVSLTARLVDLEGGSLGILIDGRPEQVYAALASAPLRARSPAFMGADYPEVEWQGALRTLRMGALEGHMGGLEGQVGGRQGDGWRLGTTKGLYTADIASARDAWRRGFSMESLRSVLIADSLLTATSAPFAAAWAKGRSFSWARASGTDRQGARIVLAEYRADGSAFPGAAPRAPGSGGDFDASRLASAKARALAGLFGRGDGAIIAMGLDLAAGGDGALPFLLADSIEASDAMELATEAAAGASGGPAP